MPKKSVKENKKSYHSKREELGLSREQASEKLDFITPERLEKIENGRSAARPDEILRMSEVYNMPSLCNEYCAHECAIGVGYVPEVKVKDLSRIVLEMLASLNSMEEKKNRLIEIAANEMIEDDEVKDFVQIQRELEKVSMMVEALQLWCEEKVNDGTINRALYEKYKG